MSALFSADEERAAFEALAAARAAGDVVGARRLRDRIVARNRGLAWKIAREHARGDHDLTLDDLAQEATLGVLHAIDRFNVARGVKFATFAIHWIRFYVQRAITNLGRAVRRPVHALEARRRAGRASDAIATKAGERLGRGELAALVGVRVATLDGACATFVSLDTPLGDDGGTTRLERLVDDTDEPKGEDAVLAAERAAEARRLLAGCDARVRQVLAARFGFGGAPRTLAEIGAAHGVTRERVRQIEAQALEELRGDARTELRLDTGDDA